MAKRKSRTSDNGNVMDLIVGFGNVNIGDKTARIGITVDRGNLSVSQADQSLCGRRLTGTLIAQPDGDAPGQETFPGMDSGNTELNGSFDVKGFNVTAKNISFGLTFSLKDLEMELLGHFAKRNGRLNITEVAELPDEENENGESNSDGEG